MGSALGGSPFKLQWLAQRWSSEACAPQDPRGRAVLLPSAKNLTKRP